MRKENKHKRLFNDNNDLVTSQIVQGINRQLNKRTFEKEQIYNFDFFNGQSLQRASFQWDEIKNPRPNQGNHKDQSEDSFDLNHQDLNSSQKALTQVESYKLFQEYQEECDIAEEAVIRIPNISNKLNSLENQDIDTELCDLPHRKTIQIYPNVQEAQQLQSQSHQFPRFSIKASVNSNQSIQCTVTQSLRLSCISYLETRSTLAEEEDFSPDEAKIIQLLTQKKQKYKIFEDDEVLPCHQSHLTQEEKQSQDQIAKLNQVFDE